MGIKKTEKIWVDGELIDWDLATDHVLTHTLHYGLGAFEGIRAYNCKGRAAIFRLPEHIDRLFDSCTIATLEIPFSRDQLMQACLDVVRVNKLGAAYVRPLIYLGSGALGLGTFEPPVRSVVAAFEWGAYLGEEGLTRGIRCKVSGFRRASVDAAVFKGKICGQYVTSILAKRDALKEGYDEAILLDSNGLVAEGSGENIFLVRDQVIYTPPTSAAILAGVTRDTVITLAREAGYTVVERSFTRDELWTADEAFFTGTAAEVTPIREIDRRQIGAGEPGPITRDLQERYFAVVKGEADSHREWLSFVS
jgi:branched-chain amino acid aminotransferase